MALKHKKRILITIDWFLPGYKAGGPIQSCANLIAHLKEDHDFWVITRNTDYTSDEPYAGIPSNGWYQLEEGVQVYYFSERALSYASLTKVIKSVQVDVIYINGIFSKFFSLMPLLVSKRNKLAPVIVAARGMFAPGAVGVKSGKKKFFFSAAKWLGLYNNITFHATNVAEQSHIQHLLGEQVKVAVAPNLPKIFETAAVHSSIQKLPGLLKLVSVARISPEKNTRYALEALKRYSYTGDIIFDIYGPVNDEAYWDECRHLIKQIPSNIIIHYKGSIPSNLVPEVLAGYHALLLPTRGENFGHIILESLTSGLPVIISDQTPWKDLQVLKVGYDLPLAEPSQFASAIQELLDMDQGKFDHLSQSAALFASKFIQNDELVADNKALFSC